ncbi:hypothetical protein RRF57_007670 [Xylaria bambusicola]|uniref:Uncharacterized protein n=1 Tax=Xylaria bambusicola TaxID=326684 RepID=A0AAN7ZAK8_9PEZI
MRAERRHRGILSNDVSNAVRVYVELWLVKVVMPSMSRAGTTKAKDSDSRLERCLVEMGRDGAIMEGV